MNYKPEVPPPWHSELAEIGNFASQDFDICLRNLCEQLAENCGLYFNSLEKYQQVLRRFCGDGESAQKVRRQMSESWLVKIPRPRCGTRTSWRGSAGGGRRRRTSTGAGFGRSQVHTALR